MNDFRSLRTLEDWLDEYVESVGGGDGSAKVVVQDGEGDRDTGLVTIRLTNTFTSAYVQPSADDAKRWVCTLDARPESLTLEPVALRALADQLHALTSLCEFLERKSAEHDGDREP